MSTPIWDDKRKMWRYRVTSNCKTKSFYSSKAGLAGKREVLKKAREFESFGSTDKYKMRVAAVWPLFLEDVAKRIGPKAESYRQYESLGRLYVLPALGPKRMSNLSKQDLQAVINNARPIKKDVETLSKKYLSSIRMTLNVFYKFAVENGYAEPFFGSLYIPVGHPVIGKEILQPEHLRKLFEPSEALWYLHCFQFLALTGVRPGESIGLKWSDIKKDYIEIHRSINTRNLLTEGKNKNAKRIIPLSPIIRDILLDQRKQTADLHSEWVFCDKVGEHGNQKRMRYEFGKLKEDRDIPGSLYSLRHTFVSMVKNTMPEQMVKSIVGHSVSMDTFGVYGHMVNGEMKQAAKLIDLSYNEAIHEQN